MISLFGEFSHIGTAVSMFLDPMVLLILVIGVILGMAVGAIPGLTATMTMALLLGFTYGLETNVAIAALIGVYISAIYAGGITATMINIPGTPAAAATAIEGFELAKQGKGKQSIMLTTISSVVGAFIGSIICYILIPFVAYIALKFSSWHTFIVAVTGVLICGSLSGSSPLKGWTSGIVGILLSLVGIEELFGHPRFAFGNTNLMGGLGMLPAMVGLFGLAEVLHVLKVEKPYTIPKDASATSGKMFNPFPVLKKYFRTIIRSSFIGMGVGLIPGIGESLSCWVSYDAARRGSKEKEMFGKGSYEGVIASETANNATAGGALIPMLTMGIPGSAPTAILMGAMLLHGLRPGPLLIKDFPGEISYIFLLVIFSAVLMGIFGLVAVKGFVKLLSIDRRILLPIVMVFCVIGCFGSKLLFFDVWVLLFFGILGALMKAHDYPVAPMVLGVILGKLIDTNLRFALVASGGSVSKLTFDPISIVLIIVFILSLIYTSKGAKETE